MPGVLREELPPSLTSLTLEGVSGISADLARLTGLRDLLAHGSELQQGLGSLHLPPSLTELALCFRLPEPALHIDARSPPVADHVI